MESDDRCAPLVTAVSGTDVARPVAGGLDLLASLFPHPRPSLPRIAGVKGGARHRVRDAAARRP